ncbi:ABC transporter permease [Streptomyces sp. PsTaAH-124]|uniref:ABC transporter permease n=1 Tax=Streptomyces sp. PsTaAH-124 TaxID=1157638 RepID=UPI000369FA0F|nr:ABC transporter permease [Streptomyces sp. PsTaAH-124]
MTASALTPLRAPRLRGLTWLVWRQNRAAFWIGLAFALAVAAYTVVKHQDAVAAIDRQHLQVCRGATVSSKECFSKIVAFGSQYQYPMRRPLQAMVALPLLFGLFFGGPQLAQELESGTYRTACSQSVSRVRWFLAKLAVPAVMTAVISAVLATAMTWWWHPVADLLGGQFPWYQWYPYYGIGPVVVGLSVLLFVIGAACGLLLRRTVAAMAATLVVGTGVLVLLDRVRAHLLPTVTVNKQHTSSVPDLPNAWVLSDGPLSASGARVSDVTSCYSSSDFDGCLAAHGRTGHWADYHPASHLWPLQWAETGLCLVLAAALTALCVWWVRRRLV